MSGRLILAECAEELRHLLGVIASPHEEEGPDVVEEAGRLAMVQVDHYDEGRKAVLAEVRMAAEQLECLTDLDRWGVELGDVERMAQTALGWLRDSLLVLAEAEYGCCSYEAPRREAVA